MTLKLIFILFVSVALHATQVFANPYDTCKPLLPGIQIASDGDVSPAPSTAIASNGAMKDGAYQVTFTQPQDQDFGAIMIKVYSANKPREIQYLSKDSSGAISGTSTFLKFDSSGNCVEDYKTGWTLGSNGKRTSEIEFSPKACLKMDQFFKINPKFKSCADVADDLDSLKAAKHGNEGLQLGGSIAQGHLKDLGIADEKAAQAFVNQCEKADPQASEFLQKLKQEKIPYDPRTDLQSTMMGVSAEYEDCLMNVKEANLKATFANAQEELHKLQPSSSDSSQQIQRTSDQAE